MAFMGLGIFQFFPTPNIFRQQNKYLLANSLTNSNQPIKLSSSCSFFICKYSFVFCFVTMSSDRHTRSSCGVQTTNDNELNLQEDILQHLAVSVNSQQIEVWSLGSSLSYNNLQNILPSISPDPPSFLVLDAWAFKG
jgi:hypothetical protein